MTKTDLITAINTQLTAIITQAKVRLASLQLVNELYPVKIVDTELTTNVFSNPISGIAYRINIIKSGNNVNMYGYLRNNNTSIISLDMMEITNSTFFPENVSSFDVPRAICNINPNNNSVMVLITPTSNLFRVFGNIGAGHTLYFNFNYKTND